MARSVSGSAPSLDEQGGTGKIVNAEGLAGEKQLWGKPSNWCDYSGPSATKRSGWRFWTTRRTRAIRCAGTRADTACCGQPFGVSAFTNDKSQNSPQTVEPGKSLRYRYRVIVHPGDVQSAGIPALYSSYISGK